MTRRKNAARLVLAIGAILFVGSVGAETVGGVVAVGEGKCQKRDRVVIATNMGFTLAEQYSGSFDRDDQVVGELNSFGFKDVLVNGRAAKLYIDDYMASKDKAGRWCFGND